VQSSESVDVPGPPSGVFAHIARLDAYPTWLRLVHDVTVLDDDRGRPVWAVELRARVGPFARSKQLRMVRTQYEPDRSVTFERAEVDGRQHAMWSLRAVLEPIESGTRLTMHLAYDGAHWTGAVLARVLDDEIARARTSLVACVSEPPRQ
jgi:uncharacterized membrane protein